MSHNAPIQPTPADPADSGPWLALPDTPGALRVHRGARADRRPVVLLHGIQSHPAWFVGSAEFLARRGHPVYQLQRRGSGSSAGPRGHARSWGQLRGDLDAALDCVGQDAGADRPCLIGISWGGKYAACYALDRPDRLAGLVLVAPGLSARVDLPLATKLAVGVCAALAPRRAFPIPLNEPELFTDNPARQAWIRDDPLRLRAASARFLAVSRWMDRRLAAAPPGSLAPPVHLLLARRDRIIDNARTRALLERLAQPSLAVTELPASHTLEFEPDPGPFHETLAAAVEACG